MQENVTMKDTWTIGPLSKFSFDEKAELGKYMKEEFDRYNKVAHEKYSDSKNTSIMFSESEMKIRNEVMRRNTL